MINNTVSRSILRKVINDDSITPTGSYATSTYYNTSYGVKIGYMANGDVILSMRSGTTTAYEVLLFTLASAPSGVTITAHSTPSTTAGPAAAIYACVLSGISGHVTISVAMNGRNSSYDYTTCAITVTEA